MPLLRTEHREAEHGQTISSDQNRSGWELIRVERGNASLFYGYEECAISPGILISVPPGIRYYIVPDDSYLDIRLEISDPLIPGINSVFLIQDDEEATVGRLMGIMRNYFIRKRPNSDNFCTSIQRAIQDYMIGAVDRKPSRELMDLAELMRNNINNPGFSVSEALDELHQTRSYSRRLFKAAYGCSPTAYLTQLRIGVAKLYLLSEDRSVSEVAFLCGFQDPKYFTRIFRQKTGMTPSQFAAFYHGK